MTSTVYRFGVRFEGDASALAKAARESESALRAVGKAAAGELGKSSKQAQAAAQAAGKAAAGDAAKTARETEAALRQSGARSLNEVRRMTEARKTLGMRSEHEIRREMQRTEAAYNRMARTGKLSMRDQQVATARFREEMARLNTELGRPLTAGGFSEMRRMTEARRALAVRSEHEIRREMQRTEAAYNRMVRSGTLGYREQRMAALRYREEITRLSNELGKLTTRQKLVLGGKVAAAVGAGIAVAGSLAAPPVKRAMEYDRRLADLANTAYADRDTAGRREGMRELNRMLVDAVRYGGGTRDSAATTAEVLFGAGVFKPEEIRTILREAVMAGSAANVDPTAFAQMAVTAKQSMGIKPEQMARMFGMGTFAGQQGGFEIKDMARWLPQQMAAAKAVGMFGESGFAKLAALNQAAAVTAGTRDEAGNNVVNLLAKMGSQDTIKDFKRQGVDLPKQFAEGRVKGLDALDVLGNVLEQQLAKDRNFQQVQRQLAAAKNDSERRAALEAVGGIAQGTVIGKVFQDRQALMALYGFVQNRKRVGEIERGALGPEGADAARRNFDLVASTPSFKLQQAQNNKEIAQQEAIDRLTPAISGLADKAAELMAKYPGYTVAILAATGALTALASAAGALALLLGGKGLGAILSRSPGTPGAAGPGGTPGAATSAASGAARWASRVAGKVGLLGLAGGLFFTSDEEMEVLRNADRKKQGHRGRDFVDPRLHGAHLQEPAARAAATAPPQPLVNSASRAVPSLALADRAAGTILPRTLADRAAGAVPPPALADRMPRTVVPQTLSERLAGISAPPPLLTQDIKGEILVRVTGAPGLNVEAETRSNSPRIPFRTDSGRSNLNAGF